MEKNPAHQTQKDERLPVSAERYMNQLRAHRAGKHTMITIPNPDPAQTNKRFIRVPGKEYFKAKTNKKDKEG